MKNTANTTSSLEIEVGGADGDKNRTTMLQSELETKNTNDLTILNAECNEPTEVYKSKSYNNSISSFNSDCGTEEDVIITHPKSLEGNEGGQLQSASADGTETEANEKKSKVRHCGDWMSLFKCDDNKEAKAVALDHIPGGATTIASTVYLASALIQLANEAAGCETEPLEPGAKLPDCENRVYGIKPSSILSVYIVVLGLTASFFMPLIGALLDTSYQRRFVGRVTAALITLITFIQSFVSSKFWFPVALLQFLVAVLLSIHLCVVYAYIPELTDDKLLLAKYNARISVAYNATIVVFLVGMTLGTTFFGVSGDNIKSARIAMAAVFVCQVVFYGYSWAMLFGPRHGPKSLDNSIGNNQTHGNNNNNNNNYNKKGGIIFRGFKQVKTTLQKIFRERSEIKWFLLSRSFTQAAVISLGAATITFLTDHLKFSSMDIGVTILIMLACAIPGNKLSIIITQKLKNPLVSLRLCFFVWMTLVVLMALILSKPGQKRRVFSIAVIWGLVLGWKEPTEKSLFCDLIPKGHEAEMMGLYIFASHIFTWLPPLIFTVMNESGVDMRIGLGSLAGYFVLGLVCLMLMGSYEHAVASTLADEKQECITSSSTTPVEEEDKVTKHEEYNRKNTAETVDVFIEENSV